MGLFFYKQKYLTISCHSEMKYRTYRLCTADAAEGHFKGHHFQYMTHPLLQNSQTDCLPTMVSGTTTRKQITWIEFLFISYFIFGHIHDNPYTRNMLTVVTNLSSDCTLIDTVGQVPPCYTVDIPFWRGHSIVDNHLLPRQ